jgi:DNA invertase Pin-like site-specific DNA recombinase
MGRVIGYRRVSTDAQSESGAGLDAQLTTIESVAARLNLPLLAVHDDAGLSGSLPLEQRPALLAAIDALRAGDVLAVSRRDRLGRDALHTAMIQRLVERKGARIVSPDAPDTNDPASRLLTQLLDAFAEFERQIIRQRTRSAMAAARSKGRRVGHVPFGRRVSSDGRHLEPNPDEQAVLREIHRLRTRGYALLSIAETLNENGFKTRHGRPWKQSAVGQLLERHPMLDCARET